MLDEDGESFREVRGRSSRPAGWLPSALVASGLVLLGFLLVRVGGEGSSESMLEPRSSCRVLLGDQESPVFTLGWSPDGRRLAASGAGPVVRLWDLKDGRVKSVEGTTGRPRFILGWSREGRRLVLAGFEEAVESWELGSGSGGGVCEVVRPQGRLEVIATIARASRGATIRVRGTADRRADWLPASDHAAISAAFAPDGLRVVTAEVDRTVRVWDVETGRLRHTFRSDWRGFGSVAFSPDGSKVAAGGGGPLKVWDATTGAPLATLGPSYVGSAAIAFSPDGTRLAAANWDGAIRFWDLSTGLEGPKLTGHDGQVLAMAWSPDGQTLASGGYDSTVRLWHVGRSVEVAQAD